MFRVTVFLNGLCLNSVTNVALTAKDSIIKTLTSTGYPNRYTEQMRIVKIDLNEFNQTLPKLKDKYLVQTIDEEQKTKTGVKMCEYWVVG